VNSERRATARFGSAFAIAAISLALVVVVLLVTGVITGRGRGLRAFASSRVQTATHLGRAVLDRRSVSGYSQGNFTNAIFLHHSTGYYLIEQGDVRRSMAEAGYSFWDHNYNRHGLIRPDGSPAGYSYNIPSDNTDPDGLAAVFAQPDYELPLNALSGLLQHEVIAFKSCFPVSHIVDEEQLGRYQSYYLSMRDTMDQHLDKVFIVMTPPPLNPTATDPEAASRARAFAEWLKSDEYLSGHENVFTFDFFGYLAEDDPGSPEWGMLRADYREGTDSHPNRLANETIGPVFAQFIVDAVETYRTGYE